MNNLELYNRAYSKSLGANSMEFQDVNSSLLGFLNNEVLLGQLGSSNLQSALELGCGAKSVLGACQAGTKFHHLHAMDFSPAAIEIAKQIGGDEKTQYKVGDILEMDSLHQYDFILDAHCLHCLESREQLGKALKSIHRSLKAAGIFAGEVMISHKGMAFDFPWIYSQDSEVLFYEDSPRRLILNSFSFEQALIENDFQIQYFYIFNHKRVIPDTGRSESLPSDPQLLRFIARANP